MSELPQSPPSDALDVGEGMHRLLVPVAFGLALGAGVLAIVILARHGAAPHWPLLTWSIFCALTGVIIGGIGLVMSGGETGSVKEKARFALLTLGALLGLWTTVLGFTLPFTEYAENFASGLKELRKQPGSLIWTGLALFGGLTLMFASLQLARGQEKTSPNLRRLLYGFNAVLGVILLTALLALLNILPYTGVWPFKLIRDEYDWTSDRVFSISDKTRNTLASLQQPVMAYVLMNRGDRATYDMENMLEQCKRVNPLVNWSSFSRDRNRTDYGELLKKYPVQDPYGVLVVFGTEPKTEWEFIKGEDIVAEPAMSMRGAPSTKYVFKGENALMRTVAYLREGKSRANVYFTQGYGEYDLNNRGGSSRSDPGLGVLAEKLRKNNYEVKELKIGPGDKVPADADVVAVVRPGGLSLPMSAHAVKALQDYMRGTETGKKGKLIILADAVTQSDGKWVDTGLENLFTEFGVKLGKERLFCMQSPTGNPTDLFVLPNPNASNPIASTMVTGDGRIIPFVFQNARPVEALSGGPGGAYSHEVLMQTIPQTEVIAEPEARASVSALVAELRKPENRQKRRDMVKKDSVPLAVAVADSKGPTPGLPPGHPPTGGAAGTPRMIVFGDASWAGNQMLNTQLLGQFNFDLFLNSLTWLREKPDIGDQAEPKERKEYLFPPDADMATRLQILPASLMLLAVICLAGGVWIVRRR